jgi:EmrB/QacA subfamily drug resistance transporter
MEASVTPAVLPHRLLREPRRPAAVRNSRRAHWYVLGTVCIGAFMGQLDASIVTLALPGLGEDLHASVGAVEWVSLAYLLVLVCSVVGVGYLADRIGRKLLYVYGFGLFTASSLACGLAPSLEWLIIARVVQGLGAAMLQANSVALIAEALPRKMLGRGIGVQGAAQAIGLALGPALGGVLLSLGGWRLIFLINLPAGLLGLTLGLVLLPRSKVTREPGAHFDLGGAVLLAGAVGSSMLLLSLAHGLGYASPILGGLLVMSVACAFAFSRHERNASSPLVDLGLIGRPGMSIGLASGLVSYLVMFGTLLVVSYSLAEQHVGFALAGLEVAALPVALGLAAPIAGRLSDRLGGSRLTVAGLLLTSVGLFALAPQGNGPGQIAALAVTGIGLGVFTPANNASIMIKAPRGRTSVVSALMNMTRGLGTALGIALAALIYSGASHGAHATGGGFTASLIVFGAIAMIATVALLLDRPAADRPHD